MPHSRDATNLDIHLVIFHETDRAWLVGDTGEREKAVWLPKSQVEVDETRPDGQESELIGGIPSGRAMPICRVVLPEWLAAERGLA